MTSRLQKDSTGMTLTVCPDIVTDLAIWQPGLELACHA